MVTHFGVIIQSLKAYENFKFRLYIGSLSIFCTNHFKMNLILLAYFISNGKPHAGMPAVDTAAMDWFVIATLCILFFLLGCFATVAWQIWRRTTRPEPHVKLLMELADSNENDLLQPWKNDPASASNGYQERNPDWWKS